VSVIPFFILPLLLLVGCGEEIQNKVEQAKAKDDPSVPLLIPCEACREGVAKKTDKCPKCGHPTSDSVVAYKKAVEAEKARREEQRKREEEQMRLAKIEEERARMQAEIVAEQERQRKLAKQARTKAAHEKLGDEFTIPALNLEMIWVQPGTFTMGSPTTEADRGKDETQHKVTLTNGFYLGKYEVTQSQYEAVMNHNPSKFKSENRPVEMVSWNDAIEFCDKLTEIERMAGRLPEGMVYALPTEAQWEYACRAGTTTAYSWGDSITTDNANYRSSGYSQTRDVGLYDANPWGFFDMHGNVWEWTADWYAAYSSGAQTDPEGAATGSIRVLRGGSWSLTGTYLRSAGRLYDNPGNRGSPIGFRVGFQQQ
jgi:formylglycine-generating enzyme required for sulfatase activity